MEIQQWVPFVLLSYMCCQQYNKYCKHCYGNAADEFTLLFLLRYKIFCTVYACLAVCHNSLIQFGLNRSILQWLYIAVSNKNVLRSSCKMPSFLLNFNQIWILSTDYASLQYQISQKSVPWEQRWDMWTDRHDKTNRSSLQLLLTCLKMIYKTTFLPFEATGDD
jgi:hypothetical protein